MNRNNLKFEASTNIKNLIGRNLVTDQYTAIFELVKNSYDADSTRIDIIFKNLTKEDSSIEIIDNGQGMNLEDLKTKWMVIGTNNKKVNPTSQLYKRSMNGDKGIGRFSTDRLGDVLNLTSSSNKSDYTLEMNFEWNRFDDNFSNLSSLDFPYEIKENKARKFGTKLQIKKLRDIWDIKEIEKLIKQLRQLKSPYKSEDNFSIFVSAPEFQMNELEIKAYELENISSSWVKVEIPLNDLNHIFVTLSTGGMKKKYKYPNPYHFGSISAIIYFFNQGEKISFKNKLGVTVKDFGNIRIFMDKFKIHPYGESYNDWLALDARKSQGFSRFLGNRDVIGYVEISKFHNPHFIPTTSRQGLIENSYTEELRDFLIKYGIVILEKSFFKRAKNETFKEKKQEISSALLELKAISKDLKSHSPEVAKKIESVAVRVKLNQKEQENFVKNQEDIIETYQRVASKEILLHQIIHQTLIKIERIKSAANLNLDSLEEFKEMKIESDEIDNILESLDFVTNSINTMTEEVKSYLVTARDYLIRKKTMKNINLLHSINALKELFSHKLQEINTDFEIDISNNLFVKIDEEDLKAIFENLLSNSIKSIEKKNNFKENYNKISISARIYRNKAHIHISDTGVGVPEKLKDRIFDPFFTTTQGFGMGLSIVNEILKENNGTISMNVNSKVGAEFKLELKGEEK